MKTPRLLLVNPWIADFAAFDLWAKPVGLLSIAKYLMKFGYKIDFIDLTDRLGWEESTDAKSRDGRGHFRKTILPKPEVLSHIPRRYGLYGATREQFDSALDSIEKPDAILLTSHMTYWYPGVKMTADVLRKRFPETPLILGGIYATLLPEHAQKTILPDHLITGYGEKNSLTLLDSLFGISHGELPLPEFDDSGELPWSLYHKLKSVAVLTSRGCPNRCSYCATRLLNPRFSQRKPDDVIFEIVDTYYRYDIRDFAFYDDALFTNRDRHIIPIFKGVIEHGVRARFHTPNGLFAREINPELAELMKAVGFETIRLSLESVAPEIQHASSNKVDNAAFIKTMNVLENAGFRRDRIEVYLIAGLSEQTLEQALDSVRFVADQGAISRLAFFTPIPGTAEWEKARRKGLVSDETDPLLTNNSIFPSYSEPERAEEFKRLVQFTNETNEQTCRQTHDQSEEIDDGSN
ncbi:MAG: radical SAM protein [Candidatus Marinimicrobia bacterium]|nr:radical SAM protein [Candidatus Neomarinimicrobiota bacterium]